MIHGHEGAQKVLARHSSKAYLLVGPESVGKWTLAEHTVRSWGITAADIMAMHRFSVADAREAVLFGSYAPASSPYRVVLARLGKESQAAQTVLLKALEDAPDTTKFILVSSHEAQVLDTLKSRCWVSYCGLLSVDDLAAVLEDRGFKPAQARVWAERGQGQVKRALAYREVSDAKPLVNAVVKAFREKDPAALNKAADGWTDAHTDLLVTWCNEAISRHWVVFSEEESSTRGRGLPMRILVALRTDARPKLIVKSVLADLLRSMS